jgi:ferredoxin
VRLTVHVDHGLCSGTGNCVRALPAVFRLEDRKAVPYPPAEWAAVDPDELRAVADACPWAAIEVEEQPDG